MCLPFNSCNINQLFECSSATMAHHLTEVIRQRRRNEWSDCRWFNLWVVYLSNWPAQLLSCNFRHKTLRLLHSLGPLTTEVSPSRALNAVHRHSWFSLIPLPLPLSLSADYDVSSGTNQPPPTQQLPRTYHTMRLPYEVERNVLFLNEYSQTACARKLHLTTLPSFTVRSLIFMKNHL